MTSKSGILVFAGSARNGAFSGQLAAAAANELRAMGCAAENLSLADYPMPIYDADMQTSVGIPESTRMLAGKFAEHQGVLIVTPEYNQSLPPLLKNAIDWLSRLRGDDAKAMRDKPYAVLSSSSGQFGGARALIDLRKVLVGAFGALVIPEQMSLPNGENAFAAAGGLAKESQQAQLRAVCAGLVALSRQMAGTK